MGPVTLAWLLLQGSAADAKPALIATLQGSIDIDSDRFTVLAVTHDDGVPVGSPAPTVEMSGETVSMVPTGPGHWTATVAMTQAPKMVSEAVVFWEGQTESVPLERLGRREATLEMPTVIETTVGLPVAFTVTSRSLEALRIDANEGQASVQCAVNRCDVPAHATRRLTVTRRLRLRSGMVHRVP